TVVGLDDLTSSQADELATTLAGWDARNDHRPSSELRVSAARGSEEEAWAEWLRDNPTKIMTEALADLLNRYPGGEPVAAVFSNFYSEPLDASRAGDWAVCCSGGGIRSAAYCLGALQSLDSGGVLGAAKWIVGVSGGSYIASSRALV